MDRVRKHDNVVNRWIRCKRLQHFWLTTWQQVDYATSRSQHVARSQRVDHVVHLLDLQPWPQLVDILKWNVNLQSVTTPSRKRITQGGIGRDFAMKADPEKKFSEDTWFATSPTWPEIYGRLQYRVILHRERGHKIPVNRVIFFIHRTLRRLFRYLRTKAMTEHFSLDETRSTWSDWFAH
jgi:hypothetical protein